MRKKEIRSFEETIEIRDRLIAVSYLIAGILATIVLIFISKWAISESKMLPMVEINQVSDEVNEWCIETTGNFERYVMRKENKDTGILSPCIEVEDTLYVNNDIEYYVPLQGMYTHTEDYRDKEVKNVDTDTFKQVSMQLSEK